MIKEFSKKTKILIFFILTIILFLFISILKYITLTYILPFTNLNNPIFRLNYIENTGAAFNILENQSLILILFSIYIVFFLIYFITKNILKFDVSTFIAFSILMVGILGNLSERFFLKVVQDFIELRFIQFPIFNYFDMCITISTIFIIYKIILTDSSYLSSLLKYREKKQNENADKN